MLISVSCVLAILFGSNSSLFRNATSSEELHSRLAGLKMEVTSRTSEISTQNQSLVVKTTTIVSQTTNNTTANGEVETSQTNETQQMNSELNDHCRFKTTVNYGLKEVNQIHVLYILLFLWIFDKICIIVCFIRIFF